MVEVHGRTVELEAGKEQSNSQVGQGISTKPSSKARGRAQKPMCKFICSAWNQVLDDVPKLPWQIIKICGFGVLVYFFSLSYWGNLARCHIFDRDGCKPHLTVTLGTPDIVESDVVDDYSLFPSIDPDVYPTLVAVALEIRDAGVGDLTRAELTPSLYCVNDCGRVLGFQFGSGAPQTFAARTKNIEISHLRLALNGKWFKKFGKINFLLGAFDGKSLDNARLTLRVHCEKCQIEEFSESWPIELE